MAIYNIIRIGGNIMFPAHIRYDGDEKQIQTVEQHLVNTATYASEKVIDELKDVAYLAGLLHDMGKYTKKFKEYINKVTSKDYDKSRYKNVVNHTFSGVRYVMETWHNNDGSDENTNLLCEILAYAIGSHHGSFDCVDSFGKDGYKWRIEKEGIGYKEVKQNYINNCDQYKNIHSLFDKAKDRMIPIIEKINTLSEKYVKDTCYNDFTTDIALIKRKNRIMREDLNFYYGMVARLILSAVVDADRQDTAEFCRDITFPKSPDNIKAVWVEALENVNKKISDMDNGSKLNIVRNKISDECISHSGLKNGTYKLFVPTGGGKTLTSLKFALKSAAENEKKRIFFIIPLLSVLEQNAKVIREFVQNDSIILEHHSNVIIEKDDEKDINENELIMETWNSPIVITTLVQFLNTLFSGKNSCVRRMNSLTDSVIVIDEVQSVPIKMLSLFNLAINFLSNICGATVVLCSATQPALYTLDHRIHYNEPENLVPYDKELYKIFDRTTIVDKQKQSKYTSDEIAGMASECVEKYVSTLVICNTKKQARKIFDALRNRDDINVVHISTAMCMKNRIDTFNKIEEFIRNKQRFICVSTQVMEAGVDLSFGSVIRVCAGLDNIIQAAGRCNRNGELGNAAPVYVVNYKEEDLKFLKDIKNSQEAYLDLIAEFKKVPHEFEDDIASQTSIDKYYKELFEEYEQDYFDYHTDVSSSILKMLSDNSDFIKKPNKYKYCIRQAFKTAGKNFKVFDDYTHDIIVPYGDSERLIADIQSQKSIDDLKYRKQKLLDLKQYTISVFEYERELLEEQNAIYCGCNNSVLILDKNYYSDKTGLVLNGDSSALFEEG